MNKKGTVLVQQEESIYVILKVAYLNQYTVTYISENTRQIRDIKEKISTLTMMSMRVSGKMIRNMEMGVLNLKLKNGNMLVSGKTTFDMGRVNLQT